MTDSTGQTAVERRLAAILAADVVGYSRLMGADEAGTAKLVRERREVATPILEKRPVPPPKQDRERMLQAEDLGIELFRAFDVADFDHDVTDSVWFNHFGASSR
jgi:hypothetical protein